MFRKMSFKKSNNTSQSELPIAESTHIEDSTPSKNSKLTWSNRFGLRSNTVSPIVNQSAKRSVMNKSNLSKLDPTVYLDTQSNGFASRVVKYYEASEAKSRPISNQSYRRPGDFPIVNLEKSELSLNPRKENFPKISKLNIAPPINLVSHASARSAIFRTGKNYGESIGPIVKDNTNSSNTTSSNKSTEPLPSATAHDEPIVPNENDYNGASARSSLDALKEISRKRIRCEELDSEHDKRKKPEISAYDFDSTDGTPFGVATKRTRDRISPTNSSPAPEAQNKRYRNNDILSSLSSSVLINSTKRVLDYDLAPPKRHEPEKQADEAPVNDVIPVSGRPSIKDGFSRIGASNSDLPHHKPAQYPKIVSKSMSDSAVGAEQQTTPQKQASKMPKLTLFNKDYGTSIPDKGKNDIEENEEDDENSISFVKPKSSTSTIFSLNKKKDSSKTKLAMMLSFLRGDESRDEVDSTPASNTIINTEKKEEEKDTKSTNLSTSTIVTFSTATTTSVLSSSTIPSSAASTKPSENSTKATEASKEVSKNETVSKPLITFSPMPATKPALSTAQTNIDQEKNKEEKNDKAVTTPSSFTIPLIPTSEASPNKTIVSLNTTGTSPRLGGFAFSATQASQSAPNATNSVSTSQTTQSGSLNKTLAPTFSFEASKPSLASSTSATPTFSFGSKKADEPPKSTSTLSGPGLTSSAPVVNSNNAFNLGTAIPKPAQSESNKISFTLPTTKTMSTVQSAPVTSAPAGFSFGSPVSANINTSSSTLSTNTSSNTLPTNVGSSTFAFGSNTPSTPAASPFGSVKSPITSLPTFGSATTTNNSTPQFGNSQLKFGGNQAITTATTTTTTASTPVFGSNNTSTSTNSGGNLFQFGNSAKPNVTTQSNTFGMSSTSTPTTNLFGATGSSMTANSLPKPAFAFGNKTENPLNNTATTTTTVTPSIFGSPAVPTTAPPSFASSFSTKNSLNSGFGGGFSSTFGQPNKAAPSNTATTTATTNMFGAASPPAFASTNNIFGSASSAQSSPAFGSTNNAQNTPVFGGANNNSTQSPSAFGFSNQSTTPPNQNAFSFGQTQSPAQPAVAVTTASIFGSSQTNTNTNTFVFGQSNTLAQASPSTAGIFGSKPPENNSQTMTAPPAFGSSTNSVFNFTPKPNMFGNSNTSTENKPAAFSFNPPNNNASSVSAFGSAPSFGSPAVNNNANQPFAFGTQSTQDAPKPFNFTGPTSAPTQGASAPFSFSAPNANAFQFNAGPQQPATTNIFSIGPGTPTTKTGRPMRTATRRIK